MRLIYLVLLIFAGMKFSIGADLKNDNFQDDNTLLIGWAQTDITPQSAACLAGMTYVRVSTEVIDPLTATALVLDAPYKKNNIRQVVFVSCDLRNINGDILDGVRDLIKKNMPEINPMSIILNATHTHNAPPLSTFGLPLKEMDEPEYVSFVVPRIAAVIEEAWKNRQPGGISFGLSHAMIGHNRIMAYEDGSSRMGGNTDRTDFSHVEGYEDPATQLMYTWDKQGQLTGVVVNIAVTAQTTQGRSVISADYWHDFRNEIRSRLGSALYVLPQCSAAGDQMSRPQIYKRAENRMQEITGRSYREQIAVRLADAVTSILPFMDKNIDWKPMLVHHWELVPLTRRMISKQDVEEAQDQAKKAKQIYEQALAELEKDPDLLYNVDWRREPTRAWREVNRGKAVEERYNLQKTEPYYPAALHVIRLGDLAFATSPFELYIDFGIQIKARSKAVQTFVVELANRPGSGYVPTARSVAGGAYGAVPASTNVGPEGGKDLVNWTVNTINELWK